MIEKYERAVQAPDAELGLLDADKPGLNLDFPVNYTPTLYFAVNGKRYMTDPSIIGTFDAPLMKRWVDAAVAKSRK